MAPDLACVMLILFDLKYFTSEINFDVHVASILALLAEAPWSGIFTFLLWEPHRAAPVL